MSEDRKTCFVVMPFSETTSKHTMEYWTDHFEKFLKPLIERNPNLEARRSKPLRGDILNEIIKDLVTSPIVVADLTDGNANVYWELGVRQSFKHGTITITQAEEEGIVLPFDVSGKGTLKYYPNDHIRNEKFRIDFNEAIEDCLLKPDRPDSQVLETLSGRGTLFEILHRNEAIRRLDALLSECNSNLVIMKDILNNATKNQTAKDKTYVTSRLRLSALELLITNRYIDEDSSFFELAEKSVDKVLKINEELNIWQHKPGLTEKWLIKYVKIYETQFKELKEIIEAARDKLGKRL